MTYEEIIDWLCALQKQKGKQQIRLNGCTMSVDIICSFAITTLNEHKPFDSQDWDFL